MQVRVVNIIPSKLAENVQTTQYTAVNCRTIIDKFAVTNTTATPVVFTVNLVPLAGAAATANQVMRSKSIAPNETYNCPEVVGHTLEPGGFISTIAGTAAALALRASGREIT